MLLGLVSRVGPQLESKRMVDGDLQHIPLMLTPTRTTHTKKCLLLVKRENQMNCLSFGVNVFPKF